MIGYPSGPVWRYLALLGLRAVPSKKIVLFLNITRLSKIVSRAVATRATTSVDHLRLFRKRGVRSAECGVRSAECGVRSAECGV